MEDVSGSVSGCDEETLRSIKAKADPLRHGEASSVTSEDRAKLLTMTWNVVDGYLNAVWSNQATVVCIAANKLS
jgi:hypothetical protein